MHPKNLGLQEIWFYLDAILNRVFCSNVKDGILLIR